MIRRDIVELIKSWLKSWLTSVAGGIVGLPQIIQALSSEPIDWQMLATGIGALLLGLAAKDSDVKEKE